MINIIVASHGPMANAMLDSARMVYGDLPYCYAVTLTGEAGIEGFKQDFARVLAQASQHAEGVLVLCDMQSGTPWNVASSAAFSPDTTPPVAVLGGVNLPMLLHPRACRRERRGQPAAGAHPTHAGGSCSRFCRAIRRLLRTPL